VPYRRKPIPRVYFSHPGKISEQFPYFYELTYWLMAINKQYSKRRSTDLTSSDPIGAVINSETVEEYKELARQLVTDVRTFGVQLPEFVTTMSVSTGYGEAVCFIINDLLNKFLIKQDFKFLTPQVWQGTKDVYGSENHESDEITEEIDGDPLEDILQSAVPAALSSDDEAPALSPPPETTSMINTQIDPTDWALEVAHVHDQLVFSDEDLRAENQDWLVRMRTMIGSFRRFAGVAAGGVREKLMGISQNWSSGLEKLGRGETMVRELCKKDLSELSAVLVRKRQVIGELNGLRERVSGKIEEFDRIKADHEELLESIESLSQSTTDSSPLERLKTAMAKLKTEIRHMELTEAITASRIAEGAVRSVSD
jgi:NIMA (never in mitosis gene a)-related kinase